MQQHLFYDTCSLLNQGSHIFEDGNNIYISSITLKELENIKTSASKDQDVKFKARKLIHALSENEDKYTVVNYKKDWDMKLSDYPVLSDNNDSRIILSALILKEGSALPLIFMTDDLACKKIAEAVNLKVDYNSEDEVDYRGYVEVSCATHRELEEVYDQIYGGGNPFELMENQYLLVKDPTGRIIDHYKYVNGECIQIKNFLSFDSMMFGKVKPKDSYQLIAMDSLKNNKITVLRGSAGVGKSYLAMAFLFDQLEHGEIDRILVFCNTVATAGSAKLGFYPGSRDEKLLDSQIGNFLASKIGDKGEVMDMVAHEQIVLLPMSDIRGYDTSGMKAGVYITEAQNMDIELMKLALQRIGEDSICILDGDTESQVDLGIYAGRNNGLRRVSEVFRGDNLYGEVTLPIIYRSHIAELAEKM